MTVEKSRTKPAINTKHDNNTSNQSRRSDIQGLRAIAVLAVVAFHSGLPLTGGFSGVDVFFVISGFVITQMLSREWLQYGSINLPQFYFRRFKRLIPALSLMVSVTIALSAFILSPLASRVQLSTLSGIGAVLMTANIVIAAKIGRYFDAAADGNPLLNTWSLSVEEQFYIFFPALLLTAYFLIRRNKSWHNAPLVIVSIIGLLSLQAAMLETLGVKLSYKLSVLFGFYSPVSRAWEFAVGAILALIGNRIIPYSKVASNFLAVSGVILVGLSFFIVSGKTPWPGPLTLLPVIGTTALILAGSNQCHASVVSKMLEYRPVVYIGDISYSWYLWHWPFIVLASFIFNLDPLVLTLAATISLIPAVASYHLVENPLRHLAPMRLASGAKFVLLTLLPPITICLFVLLSNSSAYWSSQIKEFQKTIDTTHAGNATGCGQGFVPRSASDKSCLWNAQSSGMPIYLIGDSNADLASEAVINAGAQIGSPVRIFTKGGCSFLGRSWSDRNAMEAAKCLDYVDSAIALLERSQPGIVILGMSDSIWYPGPAIGSSRETESTDTKVAHSYLQEDLNSKVMRIKKAGHKVLLLLPIPKFVKPASKVLFDPAKCMTISVLNEDCPKKITVTSAYEDELQRDARYAISLTAKITNSELLDLKKNFCTQNLCSNIGADGRLLYRDAGHLTARASAEMTDLFSNYLRVMTNKK